MFESTPSRAFALLLTLATAGAAGAQDVHPTKASFADFETWPAVSPGQHPLHDFVPFRAVYERVYRDANGEQRDDRVIITAERVAWGETGAILVTLIDAGNLDYDDTSARTRPACSRSPISVCCSRSRLCPVRPRTTRSSTPMRDPCA